MRRPTLDPVLVAEFLASRFGAVEHPVPIAGGEWSSAFAFDVGGEEFVVRFGSYPEDYAKDRVAAAWAGPDLPVPEMVELGDAFDGAYAVSRRAPGVAVDSLDRSGIERSLPALVHVLAALGRIELPGSGFGIWRPDDVVAPHASWRAFLTSVADRQDERISGWRERLAAVPGAQATFEAGCARLGELVGACPERRALVHGDLLAGNVLVDGDKVTAVLDWGNSMAGDPLYDLAWLIFWAPWHPGLDPARLRSVADDLDGGTDIDERLRCYQLHIGLDGQQYCAFTRNWPQLAETAARTTELALD